jgi:hypothetical protein
VYSSYTVAIIFSAQEDILYARFSICSHHSVLACSTYFIAVSGEYVCSNL